MNKMNTTRKDAADAVEDVIAEATKKAKRVRAEVGRKAGETRTAAQKAAASVTDAAADLGERDLVEELRDFARRHPATTLIGAALAGAALSTIVLRAGRR